MRISNIHYGWSKHPHVPFRPLNLGNMNKAFPNEDWILEDPDSWIILTCQCQRERRRIPKIKSRRNSYVGSNKNQLSFGFRVSFEFSQTETTRKWLAFAFDLYSCLRMWNSGILGPTLPGIDLSETQDGAIVKAVVILMVIGTILVALRLYARTMQKGITLDLDDYLILLGLVSINACFWGRSLTRNLSYLHMVPQFTASSVRVSSIQY